MVTPWHVYAGTEGGSIATTHLQPGIWRWVVSTTHWLLYSQEKAWYPFSGDGWYKKLTPMGIPSSGCPAHSMSLYRLNYPDCLTSNYTGNKLSHTEVIVRQSTFTSIMLVFTYIICPWVKRTMQIAETKKPHFQFLPCWRIILEQEYQG
jgi:hypothetical protein